MEKILKVIKINLLSLVALPLLLIATCCKLTAKALEKASLILRLTMICTFVVIIFEFLRNPGDVMEFIITMMVLFFFIGLVILIIFLLMRFAAAIIATVWNAIIALFEGIYDMTYIGFLHIYAICECDYQYISLNGKKVPNALLCFFYTILRGVNQAIMTIISWAYIASIVLSGIFVIGTIISISNDYKHTFGLNIFEALGRYDLFSAIYGIATLVSLLAIFVVTLISLGSEWHEWAMELKLTTDQLHNDISELKKSDWSLSREANNPNDPMAAYQHNLQEHINSLDYLGNLVESVLSTKDNALLRSTWGNYYRNLSEIVNECAKYKKGVPETVFKGLIPRIQQLEKQRAEVKNMATKLQELNADPVKSSVFFSGCSTPEKLEKRYKSLCKAYHPDTEGGDTETFQKMQDEYQMIKESLTANAAK